MATANNILLRRITLTESASSVTFDSIPQTGYTDLQLVYSTRTDESQSIAPLILQFNGVTTGYSTRQIYSSGSSAGSESRGVLGNGMYLGNNVGGLAASNTFGSLEVYIPGYTSSNHKTVNSNNAGEDNATTAYLTMCAGLWTNTAAITSIKLIGLSGNFVAGSSFALYGIADAATTPTAAPKADGGDIIKTDGTYWYHAFLSTGSFKPQVNLNCDYLVIAGGGGSAAASGGGGAGGLRYASNQSLSAIAYTATVGSGGVGSNNAAVRGTKGGDSTFNGMTSTGGGIAGGTQGGQDAGSGGSGGGAGCSGASLTGGAGNTPSTSPSQGNNGGANVATFPYPGGGGGGAGAVGQTAPSRTQGGNGGAGVNTYSSWATATGTGVSGYYAGGGGAGVYLNADSPTAGTGGSGGGGNGGINAVAGASGIANTGGGGGGSGENGAGGNGGSGIIIIRYPV